jgi:hypothetical protein
MPSNNHLLAVSLNNKIGCVDALIPIVLEAKARNPELQVEFYTFDDPTYWFIRDNVVLWECINHLGKMERFSKGRRRVSQARKVLALLRLAVLGFLGRLDIVHSKNLRTWPWRLLYFAAPRRCFYIRPTAFGFPEIMQGIVRLRQEIEDAVPETDGFECPVGTKVFIGNAFPEPDDELLPANKRPEQIVLDNSRGREIWLNHVWSNADRYMKEEFERVGIPPQNEIIIYLFADLSPRVLTRHPDSLTRCARQLMKSLVEKGGGRPIFVKAHIAENIPVIEEMAAEWPEAQIVATNLHVSALSTKARLLASIWSSTPMADALCAGVPTIEFAEYSDELLELTEGGAGWPESTTRFINGDIEELDQVIEELLEAPKPPERSEGTSGDPTGFYQRLAFGR